MITLYLIRHGQTYFNLYHKIQGRVDSPLTKLGIRQAEATRDYLKVHHIQFDYAFSSSSERATDTLEIITNMPYQRVKGLKEHAFGRFEAHDESLNPKPPYNDFFKQFGGETDAEVQRRMNHTIRTLLQKVPDGSRVLIMSHAGALMNFLRIALGEEAPLHGQHFENCGIVILTYDGRNFKLKKVINPASKITFTK